MAAIIGKGNDTRDYIIAIDETQYAWPTFPLPQLGKILSNLIEPTNLGLLNICEFTI